MAERKERRNEAGQTFREWMKEVDKFLLTVCGMPNGELTDAPYYDGFMSEYEPSRMAREALIEWNDYPEDQYPT